MIINNVIAGAKTMSCYPSGNQQTTGCRCITFASLQETNMNPRRRVLFKMCFLFAYFVASFNISFWKCAGLNCYSQLSPGNFLMVSSYICQLVARLHGKSRYYSNAFSKIQGVGKFQETQLACVPCAMGQPCGYPWLVSSP